MMGNGECTETRGEWGWVMDRGVQWDTGCGTRVQQDKRGCDGTGTVMRRWGWDGIEGECSGEGTRDKEVQ